MVRAVQMKICRVICRITRKVYDLSSESIRSLDFKTIRSFGWKYLIIKLNDRIVIILCMQNQNFWGPFQLIIVYCSWLIVYSLIIGTFCQWSFTLSQDHKIPAKIVYCQPWILIVYFTNQSNFPIFFVLLLTTLFEGLIFTWYATKNFLSIPSFTLSIQYHRWK